MQYELGLRDWRLIDEAIKWNRNYRWIEVWNGHEISVAHFAEDLSGEDQPPFSGWFVDAGSYFRQVYPPPFRWRPVA